MFMDVGILHPFAVFLPTSNTQWCLQQSLPRSQPRTEAPSDMKPCQTGGLGSSWDVFTVSYYYQPHTHRRDRALSPCLITLTWLYISTPRKDGCGISNGIFSAMYILVSYLAFLYVVEYFRVCVCVCENTRKIEYPSSTVQVVCDKAILSGSESAVIASVPHLWALSLNSAKELLERPICTELNHSLEQRVAWPDRQEDKKQKKSQVVSLQLGTCAYSVWLDHIQVAFEMLPQRQRSRSAHECLINIFNVQSKQAFLFLESISSADVWRLIYV